MQSRYRTYFLSLLGYKSNEDLGDCFSNGWYVSENVEMAFSYYIKALSENKKNKICYFKISMLFAFSDYRRSLYTGLWYESLNKWKSAITEYEKFPENVECLLRLAFIYSDLRIISTRYPESNLVKNIEKEVKFYYLAALNYSAYAIDKLYEYENLIDRSYSLPACMALAKLYIEGKFRNKKDFIAAKKFYAKAVDLKDPSGYAALQMASILKIEKSHNQESYLGQELFYLIESARCNNLEAQAKLENLSKHLITDVDRKYFALYLKNDLKPFDEGRLFNWLNNSIVNNHKQCYLLLYEHCLKFPKLAKRFVLLHDNLYSEVYNSQCSYYLDCLAVATTIDICLLERFKMYCENNNAMAQFHYAMHCNAIKDNDNYIYWLIRSFINSEEKAIKYILNMKKKPIHHFDLYKIAMIFREGRQGIEINTKLSLEYYQLAYNFNDPDTAYYFGSHEELIASQNSTNQSKACKYFIESSLWGNQLATLRIERLGEEVDELVQLQIGKMYLSLNNFKFAEKWVRIASDNGNQEAQHLLKKFKRIDQKLGDRISILDTSQIKKDKSTTSMKP